MRLHPVTAVVDAGGMALSGAAAGIVLALLAGTAGLPTAVAVAVLPLAVLAGMAYGVARYLLFQYDLDGETLSVRSGVLLRRERQIPLGRVQNVDVTQTVVGRAIGVAAVRIETAGGGTTEAELAYVDRREADRLQRVLRRGGAAATDPTTPPEEGTLLFALSRRDLALLSLVSFRWETIPALLLGAPVAGSFLLSLAVDVLAGIEGEVATALAALLVGTAGVLVLVVVAWTAGAVLTAVRYWGFTLRRIGDELHYERGLLERYAGTIPLEKVQSLIVEENVLMRRLGYAALSVETAGYSPGGGDRGGSSPPSAVPLARRGQVRDLVTSLSGVADLSVDPPPGRARRRYAIRYAAVLVALAGLLLAARLRIGAPRAWFAPLLGLPLVPLAARSKWIHRGARPGEEHLLTTDGFWRRTTQIVPYYRLQAVVERRTIFQRRRDLASVTADTASASSLLGRDATAHDRDAGEARDLHATLRDRLQRGLRRRRARRRSLASDEVEVEDGDGERGPDGSDRDPDRTAGTGRDEAAPAADDGRDGAVSAADDGRDDEVPAADDGRDDANATSGTERNRTGPTADDGRGDAEREGDDDGRSDAERDGDDDGDG